MQGHVLWRCGAASVWGLLGIRCRAGVWGTSNKCSLTRTHLPARGQFAAHLKGWHALGGLHPDQNQNAQAHQVQAVDDLGRADVHDWTPPSLATMLLA